MIKAKIFKIINVIEAILVTFIFCYFLFKNEGIDGIPFYVLLLIFTLPSSAILNALVNINLLKIYSSNSGFNRGFKIFFWKSFSIFLSIMLIMGYFVISSVIDTLLHPKVKSTEETYMDFAGLVMILFAAFILLAQPIYFFLAIKKDRINTELLIDTLGNES